MSLANNTGENVQCVYYFFEDRVFILKDFLLHRDYGNGVFWDVVIFFLDTTGSKLVKTMKPALIIGTELIQHYVIDLPYGMV